MNDAGGTRAPAHLWIVGIAATLWNGFGAYDYLMTRLRDRDYLSQMPGVSADQMLAWIDSFPWWAQFGWGLGVWMGVAGSLLLLARSRYAVHAYALSRVGAVAGLLYQVLASDMPDGLDEGAMAIIPYAIMAVAAALLVYARAMRRRGVLR